METAKFYNLSKFTPVVSFIPNEIFVVGNIINKLSTLDKTTQKDLIIRSWKTSNLLIILSAAELVYMLNSEQEIIFPDKPEDGSNRIFVHRQNQLTMHDQRCRRRVSLSFQTPKEDIYKLVPLQYAKYTQRTLNSLTIQDELQKSNYYQCFFLVTNIRILIFFNISFTYSKVRCVVMIAVL